MNNEQLILQAIESAEKSLASAKSLMGQGRMPAPQQSGQQADQGPVATAVPVVPKELEELVGVIGEFDGEFLITAEGKKYQVPPNYASKSILTPGDTLRMVEDEKTGKQRFKQIKKVERERVRGVLSKKDGKWCVVTEDGSFWVLAASVKHYQGEIGDEATVHLPKDYKEKKTAWAAVVSVKKEGAGVEKQKLETGDKKLEGEGQKAEEQKAESKEKKEVKEEIAAAKKEEVGPKPPRKATAKRTVVAGKSTAQKSTPQKAKSEKEVKGKIVVDDEELR